MSLLRCLIVGVPLILAAASAAAQDKLPTYVRKGNFQVLPCVERDEGIVTERRECKDGWFTFDRPSHNIMLTITKSEEDCRRGELKRLEEPEGWDPLTVIIVAGGTVIVVGGVAFLVGYFVGLK